MNEGSYLAVGDVFITRRLPEKPGREFSELSGFIRKHDVRFANLEVTVHDREGVPSAFSGGTWAMAEPALLDDVARYGFNVYNAANNHALDYSQSGLLATIRHLKERGMNFAGVGASLADASAPVYVESRGIRTGLVAASSTFHDSWAAGSQSPDMPGRPGLNPLRVRTLYHVKPEYYSMLRALAPEIGINAQYNLDVREGFEVPQEGSFRFGGEEFVEDAVNRRTTEPLEADLKRITESVQEARRQSDFVMVSLHSHEMAGEDKARPAGFFVSFAHACIEAGASVVLGHGPHVLRGVERYRGGLIFYSLGNFLFENDTTAHQPADFFEKYGLAGTCMVGKGMEVRSRGGAVGLGVNRDVWRSVAAEWAVEDGKIVRVGLYPLSLSRELPRYRRGVPAFSRDDDTLLHLARLSEEFGTKIRIEDHVGIIEE